MITTVTYVVTPGAHHARRTAAAQRRTAGGHRPPYCRRASARRTPFIGAVAAALLLAAFASARRCDAQEIPLSQHGSVTQAVAHTEIAIEYNRPVARGRTIFGGVVPWGRVWCPGADTATRITINHPVQVNGSTLPAGSYSIWTIPDSTKWTVIFSRAAHVFHIPYPEGKDALRVTATPRPGPHMETLTFYFPVVDSTHAELVLHWGETQVPLTIIAP